jgi:flagellar basal-body rod protein FlgG
LVTVDGATVIPAITIPQDAVEVIVNKTGQVFARIDGQTDLQDLGQLTLANFANEAGLAPLGDNLFQETPASGAANIGIPGDPGYATIEQGYLEASNVDPVKEITELISAQRAYEMNSKVIQAADDMASVVSKNIR